MLCCAAVSLDIVTFVKAEHSEKILGPIVKTFRGIVIDVKLEQPWKALFSMVVSRELDSNVIDVN